MISDLGIAHEDVGAPRSHDAALARIREIAGALVAEIVGLGPSPETSRAKMMAEEAVRWAAKRAA